MTLGDAIGDADDLIHVRLSLHPAEFHPLLTDVEGENLLGEDLAAAVRPENSDRHFDFLAGLSAFTHILNRPLH